MGEASDIARLLREVSRYYLQRPTELDQEQSGLTMPQISTITVLFDHGPLSLKDLSRALSLSHSTVSGIVDRLERRGLVKRSVDKSDRRLTSIAVTDEVHAYARNARQGWTESQLGRLLPALRSASEGQRRLIREGLDLLQSLVIEQPESEATQVGGDRSASGTSAGRERRSHKAEKLGLDRHRYYGRPPLPTLAER